MTLNDLNFLLEGFNSIEQIKILKLALLDLAYDFCITDGVVENAIT